MDVPSAGAGRQGLDAMLGPEPHGAIADEPRAGRIGGGLAVVKRPVCVSAASTRHGGRPNPGCAGTPTRGSSLAGCLAGCTRAGGGTDRPDGPVARLHCAPRCPRRCSCSALARAAPSDQAAATALGSERQQLRCQPVRPWPLYEKPADWRNLSGQEEDSVPGCRKRKSASRNTMQTGLPVWAASRANVTFLAPPATSNLRNGAAVLVGDVEEPPGAVTGHVRRAAPACRAA